MSKRVLNVGQCGMDNASISRLLSDRFAAVVETAATLEETLARLGKGPFDLVLVNRVLDADGEDGLEVIRRIKADDSLAATPVMLVSNYPDYQARAVALGAAPGFGKQSLGAGPTRELLAKYLG